MNSIKNAFSGKILGEQTKSCEEFISQQLDCEIYSTWLSALLFLELSKFIAITKDDIFDYTFSDLDRDSDIVTLGREQKRLQPSRDEPEDAPSFTRRLKNSARSLPNPFSRRLEYPPIQE